MYTLLGLKSHLETLVDATITGHCWQGPSFSDSSCRRFRFRITDNTNIACICGQPIRPDHQCPLPPPMQATRVYIFPNINNIETLPELMPFPPSEQNPADSLACSGPRARLRLERRLLRFKDGSGLWWANLSSETLEEIRSCCKIADEFEDDLMDDRVHKGRKTAIGGHSFSGFSDLIGRRASNYTSPPGSCSMLTGQCIARQIHRHLIRVKHQ